MKENASDKPRKDKLIKEYNKKIEELKKKGIVDENEFCGFCWDDEDDDDVGFYDRTILREEYEESMALPYQRIELYKNPTFGYKNSKIMYYYH